MEQIPYSLRINPVNQFTSQENVFKLVLFLFISQRHRTRVEGGDLNTLWNEKITVTHTSGHKAVAFPQTLPELPRTTSFTQYVVY